MGIAAILLLSLIPWPADLSGQTQNILEQAKKEGEVSIYSTMVVSDFELFREAAKKKYPFLTLHHLRISTASINPRVLMEYRAGRHAVDVIGNSVEDLLELQKSGAVGAYISSEANHLRAGFADQAGFWSAISMDPRIVAVNTRSGVKLDSIQSYQDLLRPEFKGNIAIHSDEFNWLMGLARLWGEEKALSFARSLATQEPRLVRGYTQLTSLLAAGEFAIAAFTQSTKIEVFKEKGAPVDWAVLKPIFALASGISLAAKPPHPAASRLLIDFYLSPEGQEAVVKVGKVPVRKGIYPTFAKLRSLLDKETVHLIKPKDIEESEKYKRLYFQIFHKQGPFKS